MSAVQMLNPRAMLMRRKQALQVNVNAARGLQEVLKTNLGIVFPLSYSTYRSCPSNKIEKHNVFLFLDTSPDKHVHKLNRSSRNFEDACRWCWSDQDHERWTHIVRRDANSAPDRMHDWTHRNSPGRHLRA